MSDFPMQRLAVVRTCYPEKFGVPRQSGLVPSATAELIFEPAFRRAEAVLGLEGFSHLWLVFVFDQIAEEETRLSVRPPRLGGNEKRGVFATRSPFRPNRIGLSAVQLEGIDHSREDGPILLLSGVDLVDGTAVLDVKPYVPYADSLPTAVGGFASDSPSEVPVRIAPECQDVFAALEGARQTLIRETLSLDPRPSYRGDGDDRHYHLLVADLEITWKWGDGSITVLAIVPR